MNLIDEIKLNINEENKDFANSFIEFLIEYNISDLDSLINLENKIFTIDNHLLNTKERIEQAYLRVKYDYTDYDGLLYDEKIALQDLKHKCEEDISDEEKILSLIKLYYLTSRDFIFLKEVYNLIVNKHL